jgi:hypothetical protein
MTQDILAQKRVLLQKIEIKKKNMFICLLLSFCGMVLWFLPINPMCQSLSLFISIIIFFGAIVNFIVIKDKKEDLRALTHICSY